MFLGTLFIGLIGRIGAAIGLTLPAILGITFTGSLTCFSFTTFSSNTCSIIGAISTFLFSYLIDSSKLSKII